MDAARGRRFDRAGLPLHPHRWRLVSRRYNQSALLAKYPGELSGNPVLFDVMRRLRATPSRGHRRRKGRQDNVRGAFAVSSPASITGKNLLLIDDVLTTGATIEECARVLLKAGAAKVDVLTLSRVKNNV